MCPVLMTLWVSVLQVVLITVYESHLISFSAVHGSLWCHTSTDYFFFSFTICKCYGQQLQPWRNINGFKCFLTKMVVFCDCVSCIFFSCVVFASLFKHSTKKDLCTFNICTCFKPYLKPYININIKHLYYKNKNACTLKAFLMTTAFKTINIASKKGNSIDWTRHKWLRQSHCFKR